MPFPKGKKNPNAGSPQWVKGGKSPNPSGRPPAGQSFAEKCRAVAGDGNRLAWLYACVCGLQSIEALEQTFDLEFGLRVRQFLQGANVRDRLWCAGRLEDRAFGLVKQEVDHSGSISVPTTVIHEYHASS
jgi:hypothetical protein